MAPLIQRRMGLHSARRHAARRRDHTILFGGVSVIFAGPIAVIVFVAVGKKLYVRDSLGEATDLPGEI